MMMKQPFVPLLRSLVGVALALLSMAVTSAAAPTVEPAQPIRWQTVTLTFDGPDASEDASPNPFRDYRMSVTFTHSSSGTKRTAQGFFAADGDAANSSAKAGNKWRVRFTPPDAGEWQWTASFRTGSNVALSNSVSAGQPTAFNGESGTVAVGGAPGNATGFNAKGFLNPVGGHYLRFQNGDYFLKGGADSPENFLGYYEFDGTFDTAAHQGVATDKGTFLHKYEPHARDWKSGDPTWKGGKGKNIIGALNYLASKGMNSVYFLTYNIDGGDGKDTWVWTDPETRDRFDVSKLDQWEIVFSHMEKLGLVMHVIIQETENDEVLGGGPGLNEIRKLYLRELAARFSHHLGVIWNLGEENDTPVGDRKAIAAYIREMDPNNHAVTVHTHNRRSLRSYTGLFGSEHFSATSIQGRMEDANREATMLRMRSAAAGARWAIFHDEQTPASVGVMPDAEDPFHDKPRKQELWGNLMGGGSGVEWYFGYAYEHMDINLEDWRSRDKMWDQTRYALEFFHEHLPFWRMWPANDLTDNEKAFVFAEEGEIYAVYLPEGNRTRITLAAGEYTLAWYDPRNGGPLHTGKDKVLKVGEALMRDEGSVQITPPHHPGKDWVALIKRIATIGSWRTVPTKGEPTARHEASAVAFEGKMYLMGGRGVKPVEVFDPSDSSWTSLKPTPREIHHYQPVVYGDRIYIMSAMTGKYPKETPLENVLVYYPKRDSWETGPKIPSHRRRGGTGTVVYNGKIYVVAGIKDGHTSGTVAWFDEFDPKTGKWRELPDAPHIRDHFPAIVVGDKLYCVGGRNTSFHTPEQFTAFFGAVTKAVDVYDFKTGKWETLREELPNPTAAGGLVELGGKIIYMGGETAQKLAHNTTQALDPRTGKWEIIAPLQRGRHGAQAVVINGKIYIATGSGGRGGGPELSSTEEFSL